MFATDRDLVVLEPTVFRDVDWAGQRVVMGVGSVSGTTLTMSSQDAGFDAAGVDAGHVVVVGGVSLEVVSRVSGTVLEVSRVRPTVLAGAVGAGEISGASVRVTTFGPQIEMVHRQVLGMLGLGPVVGELGAGLDMSAVKNPSAIARLEALGALHLVYAAVSAVEGPSGAAWERARMYRERFGAERQRVEALVDVDGDGVAEVVRRPSVSRFIRG